MAKNILVTGGTGYIGSHTVVELIQSGFNPIVLDNFSNSHREVVNSIEKITGKPLDWIEGDCRDSKVYDKTFGENDFWGVIHFAAFKAVGESVQDPLKYFDNNINGLTALLQGMEKHGVNNLVFSSSCTVYGNPDKPYVTEDSPLKTPESPYGFTKYAGEKILENIVRHKQQMKVVLLRYFNPIGAHPSGQIGERPQGIPNNLLPYITQTALGIRKELPVFGNDYPTPDGTCVRDYIHVCDVASAHVAALNYIGEKNTTFIDAINIGTGKGISILEIIRIFENETEEKLNWKFAPRRDGDVPEIYARVEKATEKLGWGAKFSVSDAIKHAWAWEKIIQNR